MSFKEKDEKREQTLCRFYEKTGTCPRDPDGKLCEFRHLQRYMSRCLLFHHLFPNPLYFNDFLPDEEKIELSDFQFSKIVDSFFIDVFLEFSQFGKIEDMYMCSNLSKHLYGNVYVRFSEIDSAMSCHQALEGRFYAGRKVKSTFLPHDRLSATLCKDYQEKHTCIHGDMCPFPHRMKLSRIVLMECFPRQLQTTPTDLLPFKITPFIDDPNDILYNKTSYFQLNPDMKTTKKQKDEDK